MEGRFGLFGWPLGHSISPQIQHFLFALSGRTAEYRLLETPPEAIEAAFTAARRDLDGFNCTIPYKRRIMDCMDGCDPAARALGAVNTVRVEDGRLFGHNTDIEGFLATLRADGVELAGRRVLVLGGGGTSAMLGWAAASAGARVSVAARDEAQALALARSLEQSFAAPVAAGTLADTVPGAEIVLNGTAAGMWPRTADTPLTAAQLAGASYVFDAVYNPPETALIRAAKAAGARARGGLYMLVGQAAAAQTIWLGTAFSPAQLDAAARHAAFCLARQRLHTAHGKQNIILTGFMATGKSTVGRRLAAEMGMDFLDMDAELAARAGMSVPEIFTCLGEASFRKMEADLAAELAERRDTVVASGGGAAEYCPDALRAAGFVLFLNPPLPFILENAKGGAGRPLFDPARVAALHARRLPLYRACADGELTLDGGADARTLAAAECI